MAKRGQGEGSIYKRKDGRWVAALNLGYENGKLKRKVYYGKSHEEVRAQLIAGLSDQQKGLPVAFERQTVAQFLETWLSDVVKPSVRPRTHQGYVYQVKEHISPALGHHLLSRLSAQHVQAFIKDRLKTKIKGRGKSDKSLSARTVRHLHATLRGALNVALKWGLVARNVASLATLPRAPRYEAKTYTPEQAKAFLDQVKDDRLGVLLSAVLALGLRHGEVLGLRWEDIDFDAGTLHVRYQLQWLNKEFRLVEPKTKKSRRMLDLPEIIVLALKAHRSRQLQEKMAMGKYWHNPLNLVFTTSVGTPLHSRNVLRSFHLLRAKAGLPHCRIHDLRHTCSTLLNAQGVTMREIMEVLGHSQISSTMNIYTHVQRSAMKKAAELMNAILT